MFLLHLKVAKSKLNYISRIEGSVFWEFAVNFTERNLVNRRMLLKDRPINTKHFLAS